MKKIFAAILLTVFCIFKTSAYAEEDALQNLVQQHKQSIFVVKCKSFFEETKGSAVAVIKTEDSIVFLSARHLLLDRGPFNIFVTIDNKEIIAEKYFPLPETDCLYFIVKHSSKTVKPVKLNLEESSEIIGVLAVGYAQSSKDLTGTIGSINRTIIDKFTYPGDNFPLLKGLIKGTIPLIGGFSGGALFDIEGKLLGISIISSSNGSLFVDIRYIWNQIPLLNQGKLINYTIDPFFNCGTRDDENRIRFKNAPIIGELVKDKSKFYGLTELLIDGIKYKIAYGLLETPNGREEIVFPYPFTTNKDFIYIPENGWYIILYLAPPK